MFNHYLVDITGISEYSYGLKFNRTKMNFHTALWIFIYSSLLQCHYASSSSGVTSTISSILNLIVENSTNATFDKKFKATTLNSSNLFASNNVNTESLNSISAYEECKSNDCTKTDYISSSTENSSLPFASKVLWNIINTVKNTTESPVNKEINLDKEITIPLNFPLNEYSSNNTIANVSFYTDDNELDSEIDNDNGLLLIHQTNVDEVMKNVNNSTFVSTEPTMMTTKILYNAVDNFERNNTIIRKVTKIYPQTSFNDHSTSSTLNVNYTTTLMNEKTTMYADDDLDFTTHFSTAFESNYTNNEDSLKEDNDFKPHFFQSLSTTLPYYDSEASSVTDNSNTLVLMNYDTSIESDELKSKNTQIGINVSELPAVLSNENVTQFGNNSLVYLDYEIPFNIQDLKSKVSRMIDILDMNNNTTDIWAGENATSQNIEIKSTLISEIYDTFTENEKLNGNSTTESAVFSHVRPTVNILVKEKTNNDSVESTDSTDITERINNVFNLTLEENGAKKSISTVNYFLVEDKSDRKSTSSISETQKELTENVDFNLYNSEVTDNHHVLVTTQLSYTSDTSSISGIENQSATVFESNKKPEIENTTIPVMKSHDDFISNNLKVSIADLNKIQSTHLSSINDTNYTSTETIFSTFFDTSSVKTHSILPTVIDTSSINSSVATNIVNQAFNISENNEMNTDKTIYSLTSAGNSEIESSTLNFTSRMNVTSVENYTEFDFIPTENFTELSLTKSVPEINKTGSFTKEILETNSTMKPSLSFESTELYHTEIVKPVTTEHTYHSGENIFFITDITEEISVTDSKYFDATPVSDIHEIDSVTEFSSTLSETHREGKHIPFNSTFSRTTDNPSLYNVTTSIHSYPTQMDASVRDLGNLHNNQIKAEELSSEERTNLINAVFKFSAKNYSKEELIERMAVIHLWLLHAIADEYKNASLNLYAKNDIKTDEIEFENLPVIFYVLPSPEVVLPNISFTFVVNNKWRNETFPADIILTILNLHAENLQKILVDIEEIHFSQGLLLQKHDLMSVIIRKYGIVLLSTFLITVSMILLLVFVVIYYRKKTRYSAHCLTDDKLHHNMQEAMGIDLNPAVIILQEEIGEKAILNGSKVCSIDGEEGWLAPISDVPVEDNNAPFVQDTKL